MKIVHRVPPLEPRSAVVSSEYQAEVDRHTAKAEARYRAACRRVDRAEARLARLQAKRGTPPLARQIAEAAALVELRQRELDALHSLMQAAPASAVHRGRKSFRPVPVTTKGPPR